MVDNKIKQESIDEQQQQLKQEFEKENIELITEPVVNGKLNVDDKNNGEEKQDSVSVIDYFMTKLLPFYFYSKKIKFKSFPYGKNRRFINFKRS